MASGKKNLNKKTGNGASLGFEEKLRQAGDVGMQDLTPGVLSDWLVLKDAEAAARAGVQVDVREYISA